MNEPQIEEVHISRIRVGDAIIHEGHMRTICNTVLRRDSFMGITLFGDSYHLGYKLVKRVLFSSK